MIFISVSTRKELVREVTATLWFLFNRNKNRYISVGMRMILKHFEDRFHFISNNRLLQDRQKTEVFVSQLHSSYKCHPILTKFATRVDFYLSPTPDPTKSLKCQGTSQSHVNTKTSCKISQVEFTHEHISVTEKVSDAFYYP